MPRLPHPMLRGACLCALLASSGCGDDSTSLDVEGDATLALCQLDEALTATAGFPEGIPALTEPRLVSGSSADHMRPEDRVLGVVVDGEARAYPHNILWSHEVVNDRFGSRWITVSFCPLTGSGLAIDATIDGRRVEFGVSGLLFANNLVMYDRGSEDLFGPQLTVRGTCQRFIDAEPQLFPVQEMSWARWKALYPATKVVDDDTGYDRNYRQYPYGSYDEIGNTDLLFPMPVDASRPLKERVLGIRDGTTAGRAYPFGELARMGARVALNESVGGRAAVVFYEAQDGQTAVAYSPMIDGSPLTFEATAEGWTDLETGSHWDLSGKAVSGPLAVRRLEPLAEAYVVFWFAWRHFQPTAEVWIAP